MKSYLLIIALIYLSNSCFAADIQRIKIAYITQQRAVPPALSNQDEFIQYQGLKGAEMAIDDNNTTGQFTGQHYQLVKIIVPIGKNLRTAFKQQMTADMTFVVSNLSADQLNVIKTLPLSSDKLFFDATTTDDHLRSQQCFDNTFYLLPSRAMRADALAQYMMKKKWHQWFLVSGTTSADQLYIAAIKRAAKRFGMTIVAEKSWTHNYDARRTAQSEVSVFTQGIDYDVLVVADEQGLFGEYFSYRTWLPRPVIGTQGLLATAWHKTHEQWGAVQMQNRFKSKAGRWMSEQDYGAYLAVRALGEAIVRTHSIDTEKVKAYLLSDQFALQGYKGKPLSFRAWNGQLRQPVLLAAARSLVAVAPIEGFLHPLTELDTLGYDQQESTCYQATHPVIKSEPIKSKSGEPTGLQKWLNQFNRLKKQWGFGTQ